MLRLLLNETAIERASEPPAGFDPDLQGEWDDSLVTFAFRRRVKLTREQRLPDKLVLEYKVEDAGYWMLEIAPDTVTIGRI